LFARGKYGRSGAETFRTHEDSRGFRRLIRPGKSGQSMTTWSRGFQKLRWKTPIERRNIVAAEAADTKGAEKMRVGSAHENLSSAATSHMPERRRVRSPSRPAGEVHASVFFRMG